LIPVRAPSSDLSPGPIRGICLLLFVGTLLLFSRALGHDFVNYDDPDYVTKNAFVQAGLSAAGAGWAFSSANISYWHPLTWLSHMLDASLFGQNPSGHHATSVVLHAVNAVLAFLALRRLTGSRWTSAVSAALFAWHPLRVESVAWVAERKDVLSGTFFFLTLLAYASYVARRRSSQPGVARAYVLTLAAFAAGLMSKPMLVTVPALLLVLDCWPLGRWTPPTRDEPAPRERLGSLLLEKLPFLGLAAAVSVITYTAQTEVGTLTHALNFSARAANAAVAVASYVGKFLWPVDLAVLYPHPGHWPAARVVAAVGLILAFTAVALGLWRRRPWLLAGWLWFAGMLIPVLGFVQVGIQSMADRYTYLPQLGLQLALLWTVRSAVTSPSTRRALAWLAALVLVACAARTWDQLAVWRDSATLFGQAVRVTPNNYLAYNNLGTHAADLGHLEQAIAYYRESLAIRPDYEEANNNLGSALNRLGRPAEAIPCLEAALRKKPDLIEAHNNLGNALGDLGRTDEAIAHYEFVLARQPAHVEAMNNLGVALAAKGRTTAAIAQLQAVLRLEPKHASAHSNLGNVHALLGRLSEAVREYRAALEINPDDARTLNNLGNVSAQQGQLDAAAGCYEKSLRLEPANPETHANYGLTLARLGRRDEAIRQLNLALAQRPDYPAAREWLQAIQAAAPASK
jgi:tetratricopeptide (TPR) repeat protein